MPKNISQVIDTRVKEGIEDEYFHSDKRWCLLYDYLFYWSAVQAPKKNVKKLVKLEDNLFEWFPHLKEVTFPVKVTMEGSKTKKKETHTALGFNILTPPTDVFLEYLTQTGREHHLQQRREFEHHFVTATEDIVTTISKTAKYYVDSGASVPYSSLIPLEMGEIFFGLTPKFRELGDRSYFSTKGGSKILVFFTYVFYDFEKLKYRVRRCYNREFIAEMLTNAEFCQQMRVMGYIQEEWSFEYVRELMTKYFIDCRLYADFKRFQVKDAYHNYAVLRELLSKYQENHVYESKKFLTWLNRE